MAVAVIVVFTVAGTLYLQGNLADSTYESCAKRPTWWRRRSTRQTTTMFSSTKSSWAIRASRWSPMTAPCCTIATRAPSDMANHADRPEIAEALADGDGISERSSSTMGETMLYNAVRLDDGSVIRLSKRQEGYISIFFTLLIPLLCLAPWRRCLHGRPPAARPRRSSPRWSWSTSIIPAQYGKCLSGNGAHA